MNKQKPRCPKCGLTAPRVEFNLKLKTSGSVSRYCVGCRSEHYKKDYMKNKEKVLAAAKVYREKNRESLNKKSRAFYKKNKHWWSNWRKNNLSRWEKIQVNYRDRLRAQALAAYGGKCSCCGEEESEFLTIEHINHDGKQHRESIGGHIYADLRRRGWPQDGLTVFCWNCQMATRFRKPCPHTRRKNERSTGS